MKRLLLPLVLQLFALAGTLSACTCAGPPTFCQTVTPRIVNGSQLNILIGETFGRRTVEPSPGFFQPVIDVVVTETIIGSDVAVGDTISLIGQDGINCAVLLSEIDTVGTYIFSLTLEFEPGAGTPFLYPYQELLACGRTYLSVHGGEVTGPVAPGVESLPLAEFLSSEEYCIVGRPEQCGCTAQERDFCDDAAVLDQAGENLRIIRLEILSGPGTTAFGFDSFGFPIDYVQAEITEVFLGNDFSAGDTVFIRANYDFGCLITQPQVADVFWSYTDLVLDTEELFHAESRFPLLLEGPCVQRYATIIAGNVQTLAGPVPYNDYLDDLAECVPAVSTEELTLRMQLAVFPNPATDRLNVTWVRENVERAELLDARGRVVATQLPQFNGLLTMKSDSLPAGIYFLRLATDGGIATRRVVVR